MKYTIRYSGRFKRSFKLCKRRGLNIASFETVVRLLSETGKLPSKYHPHILTGNYAGIWECHIEPDWLLIYDKRDTLKIISLERTGTHVDLFEKEGIWIDIKILWWSVLKVFQSANINEDQREGMSAEESAAMDDEEVKRIAHLPDEE